MDTSKKIGFQGLIFSGPSGLEVGGELSLDFPFFKITFIYLFHLLFIFGCIGSLLLCAGFL